MRRAALLVLVASQAFAQDVPPPPLPEPAASAQAAPAKDAAERRDRRERLARRAGADAAVLVLAADDSPGFTGSTQNRDYTYFSPFDARGAAVLVFTEPGPPAAAPETAASPAPGTGAPPEAEPVVVDRLYLRTRNPASEKWTGPVAGPDESTRTSGLFDTVRPVDALAADLALVIKDRKSLYVSAGGPADGSKVLAPLVAALRTRLPGVWVRL